MVKFKKIIDIIQLLSLLMLLFSIIRFFIIPIDDFKEIASLQRGPEYLRGYSSSGEKYLAFFYISVLFFIIYFIVTHYIFKRKSRTKDIKYDIPGKENPFDITYLIDGYFSNRSFICLLMKLINNNILSLDKDDDGYFLEIANKRDKVNPVFSNDIYFVDSLFSNYARNEKVYIKYLSKGLNKSIDKIFANYCTVYLKENKYLNYFLNDHFIFIISILYLSAVFYTGIYLVYDYNRFHFIFLIIIYMFIFINSFKIKYYTKDGLEVYQKWNQYKNSLLNKKINSYNEFAKFDNDLIYLIAFNINVPVYSQMFKDIYVKKFIPNKDIPVFIDLSKKIGEK